jgi:hypothetical protein
VPTLLLILIGYQIAKVTDDDDRIWANTTESHCFGQICHVTGERCSYGYGAIKRVPIVLVSFLCAAAGISENYF